MNYETIKQYARQTGHKVTDLIALAPQNDPFYMGTPTDLAMAEWFAGLWRAFGGTMGGLPHRAHDPVGQQQPRVSALDAFALENHGESWAFPNDGPQTVPLPVPW